MSSHDYNKATLRYCIGALLCGLITASVYVIAIEGLVVGSILMATVILAMAVVQLVVQLFFFLHVAEGEKPRWRLHAFWFTSAMILVVVVGSIWIMRNLDYNMEMTPEQMHKYMLEEGKKGF